MLDTHLFCDNMRRIIRASVLMYYDNINRIGYLNFSDSGRRFFAVFREKVKESSTSPTKANSIINRG